MADYRPANCRFRLREEGKNYPRSSCAACGRTITTGLGTRCHRETDLIPRADADMAVADAAAAENARYRAEQDAKRARLLELSNCLTIDDLKRFIINHLLERN